MAEVLLEAYKDRPLLARWQFGLGKSVAFTSDVKDRWAVDWLKWNGYSKFWSQIVRDTMRRQDDPDFDMRVERSGGFATISVEALGKDGRYRDQLHLQVHVVAPDQSSSVIDLPQTGPGAYEARVPLKQQGPCFAPPAMDRMAHRMRHTIQNLALPALCGEVGISREWRSISAVGPEISMLEMHVIPILWRWLSSSADSLSMDVLRRFDC
jgi:hypothetical protein